MILDEHSTIRCSTVSIIPADREYASLLFQACWIFLQGKIYPPLVPQPGAVRGWRMPAEAFGHLLGSEPTFAAVVESAVRERLQHT